MCHECKNSEIIYNDGGRELCERCLVENIKRHNLGVNMNDVRTSKYEKE